MKIGIEIPDYEQDGIDVIWERNADYRVYVYNDSIHLVANAEALESFAKQMLYLAQEGVPKGSHVHFDQFFTGLKEVPVELVIAKR